MDIPDLVAMLGGADALSQQLRVRGVRNVGPSALKKWGSRGLPDSYAIRMALIGEILAAGLSEAIRADALALISEARR
mgnify:CR=1 FL=1|jgi:hypothetical protein